MKRFIKLVSVLLVFGAVATASGHLDEVSKVSAEKKDFTTVLGHCDPLERFLGLCQSSETVPFD